MGRSQVAWRQCVVRSSVRISSGNPFGWQSSNNIGLDGAYGLFRFDLGALAPKLTAKGTELTLVLTPFPLQKNQEISGTAVVHPIKSDWDEGDMSQGATWWFKRPMVAWNAPGAGGTDRGPQVSNVTITIAAAPDGGPHAFPIGDLLHTADYLGGVSGNELTFLVAPDSASAAMRLWIAGHEVSPPNGTPPILVVSTCAP